MRGKKDYSRKFHDRINKILKQAGLKIDCLNYYKSGSDTVCSVDGHKILVQCKSTNKNNKSYSGIQRLAGEYKTRVNKERAKVAILAFEKYKIPDKYIGDKLLKNKVVVWDDRIIEYYRKSVNSLNKHAKYQLMGDLGIKGDSRESFSVPALKVEQNSKEFFIFKISPGELLKYSYVFRRQYNPKAYQRMLQKNRLKDIGSFIKEEGSIFPNTIICVFKDQVKYDDRTKRLILPRRYSSIWIVDGQHRLYGFCHANKEARDKLFQLVCVGFNVKGLRKTILRDDEQARLFSDINSKAKKIPKDLLLEIKDLFGEYDRRIAVVKRLMKTDLFKNRIQTSTEKGDIHFTTFVTTPAMWKLVNDDGVIIKKNYFKKYSNLDEEEKSKRYEDICFRVVKEYFTIIGGLYKPVWQNSNKYILATDRGIRGLLRLLVSILENSGKWDRKKAREIIKCIGDFDFRENSLKRKYLGEAGADELAKDLVGKIQTIMQGFGPHSEKIDQVLIKPGAVPKAQSFIKKHFNEFEGEVIGELMFIDETTIKYLQEIPQSCGIELIVRGVKPDKDAIRNAIKQQMKQWRYVRIKEIKYYNQQGQEKTFFHGRWIADQKVIVNLEADLKDDALAPKHIITVHDKPQLSQECQEFKKLWEAGETELERDYNLPNLVKINLIA